VLERFAPREEIKMKLLSFLTAILLSFPNSLASQQATSSPSVGSPQATTFLAQSAAALTGRVPLSDVTLIGTARRIVGSDDDTGPAVFKALASGAGRTDLKLPSGQHSELLNVSAAPAGSWSGPDGTPHAIAFHNLLTEPAWFFPAFVIARRLSISGYFATYVGHETHDGQAVEHVSVSQAVSLPNPSDAATFEHLTQIDFFLDSATLLPVAIAFNIHPDDNALLDIPVEVRFSDYRSVNAAQIPFHIQKFLNNGLILDFQAQTVTVNSGLSTNIFNAL
jgi:hypothetical protein